MQINAKNTLQQDFIDDLTTITNGTATDGRSATGVHSIVHINPKIKRIVFRRFTKNLNDFYKYSRADLNCFFTVNTFRTRYRNRNNVVGLNGLWVDCDVEKCGITKRFFLHFLPDILKEAFLFPPTYIIDSGHGFHLIFLFKHQIKANSPVILRLWDRLEEKLLLRLKQGIMSVCGVQGLGIVDFQAKDCGRLLRIPGTNNLKNTKDKKLCYVISYTSNYYDLDFLREELLDSYNPDKIKKIHKYSKRSKLKLRTKMNKYTLSANRLEDLYTLARLRNYSLPNMRETFLFMIVVFGISSGLDEDNVINRIEDMNNRYQYPLEQNEIYNLEREILSNGEKLSKYCYFNSTIINDLVINDEEQEYMKVLIEKKEKQNRRKKNRRIKSNNFGSKRKKNIRNKKIKELHARGISNRKLAKELNISVSTVKRVIHK